MVLLFQDTGVHSYIQPVRWLGEEQTSIHAIEEVEKSPEISKNDDQSWNINPMKPSELGCEGHK